MHAFLSQTLRAAVLGAALCAGAAAQSAAPAAPAATASAQAAPAWAAGEYRWTLDDRNGEPPYTLRLYVQPLPSGDYALTGSLLLDDAELGAHGSARLRDGKLVLDLIASGGVLQAPMDEGKRRLYPKGKAPARVDSAGFATMRALLDPQSLEGVVQRYQTNVVTGHHVQGPMYANSVIRRMP
ncbi:MAG: hypothetical protein J0I68_29135 [Achromobacter sp.]|nr:MULTISPECIES: hypothetical protein [Achromobacter]MBN9642627.1 hypothetical protein [Achromobacter sp.]MCG2598554.1 hypothetical protein [Achromobacter sp.]MCG2603161.1 hypothetical protein [Achromobacter sp.]CAB3897276.1 hypothetical protein LMG26846_04315 [Achromobacter insuavis]CUJ78115.1 Uncharacterised protein [Achromobacter sp. 2789STDY5608633]